jgi:hypothetical protein
MVPLRSISPSWFGDWRATAHHPNRLLRPWRMATKVAGRFTACSTIVSKDRAEFP